jgi:hypothetical protein
MAEVQKLSPPFTFHGGKKRVAREVWRRLGDLTHYIDSFAGSLAMLLGRPTPPKHELVGYLWGQISNFWRAAKYSPEQMAYYCWNIPSEVDIYAKHSQLLKRAESQEAKLRAHPCYCDAEMAAWFAWGQSLWIGTGWAYRRQPGERPLVESERGVLAKRQHVGRARGVMTRHPDKKASACGRRARRYGTAEPAAEKH